MAGSQTLQSSLLPSQGKSQVLCALLASYMSPGSLATPLLIQFSAQVPGKAVEDGSECLGICTPEVGDPDGVECSWLSPGLAMAGKSRLPEASRVIVMGAELCVCGHSGVHRGEIPSVTGHQSFWICLDFPTSHFHCPLRNSSWVSTEQSGCS